MFFAFLHPHLYERTNFLHLHLEKASWRDFDNCGRPVWKNIALK